MMNYAPRFTRRHLLTRIAPAALAILGLALLSVTSSIAAKEQQKPPRPPGTCGGYVDKDGNGACDRSEKAEQPCEAEKCPGNIKNRKREIAKDKGAPEGACALWADSKSNGYCSISARKTKGCDYTNCPAHLAQVVTEVPAPDSDATDE